MAILAKLQTNHGEERDCYIRLNNMAIANHPVGTGAAGAAFTSHALFRGFLSQAAFEAGGAYVWEREIEFSPDVGGNIWAEAYAALQAIPALAEPPEPAEPEPLVEDATADQMAAHEAAVITWKAQVAEWEATVTLIAAANAEAAALKAGIAADPD